MKLYKYFSPNLTSVLVNGSVRFSPPRVFNDPFEMRPHISAFSKENIVNAMYDNAMQNAVLTEYEKLNPHTKSLTTPESFRAELTEILTAYKTQLPEFVAQSLTQFIETLNENMQEMGIFCLTQNPDSLLMWAHYADSHRGFVIEFDSESPFFNQAPGLKSDMRYLHKVEYSETRPSIVLSEIKDFSSFFTKSDDWKYEKELRMMYPLSDANAIIEIENDTIHLFNIPKSAIKSVIFGFRTSDIKKDEIRKILSANEEYKHVKILKANINETHYKLDITDDL